MNNSRLKSIFGHAVANMGVAGLGAGATLSCFVEGRIIEGFTAAAVTAICGAAGLLLLDQGFQAIDNQNGANKAPPVSVQPNSP